MAIKDRDVRVAIYGSGSFANQTHIPNLLKLDGVTIVALCDVNPDALRTTAETFNVPKTYRDGHEMLEKEAIDVLYSVVPAFARTDVEATAAARGIHLFSEKPQSTTMKVPLAIDAAIRRSGVISTVCFRERYRPIFQEARRLLQDKEVYHVRFQTAAPNSVPEELKDTWHGDFEKAGGRGFDWGVHAVDYTRFMTGHDVVMAQSFYCRRPDYVKPLSWAFNYSLDNGATMTMTFISFDVALMKKEPMFTILYEGGALAIYNYERIEVNGETVFRGQDFDPWFEQSRVFIEAVRSGDAGGLLNDYHDGLFSLAPILAGWESARREGESINVRSFVRDG